MCPCPAGGNKVTGAVVHVAEVVERIGFAIPVAEFPAEIKGSLIAGDGLLVVAEFGVTVADVIEDHYLPGPMASGTVQVEGSQRVAESLGGALQLTSHQ